VLLADERRKQTDRSGTGHQHGVRLPEGTLPDRADLLPRFGDDCGGFEQHAQEAERAVDFHRVLRLDPPALGHEAVDLLDAALGVLAVAAHVPLPHRTVGAGDGVGAPDDAHHEIALLQSSCEPGVEHAAQRLVAENQAGLAGRGPAVLPLDDLGVGAADADRHRLDEHGTVANVGFRDLLQSGASGLCGSTVIAFIWLPPGFEQRVHRRSA
jgi:hypothetical protein